MPYRSHDHRCTACTANDGTDVEFDVLVVVDEEGNSQEVVCCPACGQPAPRVPSAPMVLKATFPDGRKRQDSWYIGKEAADIRKSGFGKSKAKRAETEKAARSLEGEAHKRFRPERQ